MSTLIICALALALFQYWLIPASTKMHDLVWLAGTRDEPRPLTVMQARIERAANNLKESMPAFLALCLLSMIQNVDNTMLATIWLGLRVAFIPCYLFGINPVRTIVWLGSLACLIMMAMELI